MMTKEDMKEHEYKDVIENEKTVFDYLLEL